MDHGSDQSRATAMKDLGLMFGSRGYGIKFRCFRAALQLCILRVQVCREGERGLDGADPGGG